jgi:hypothetical protein
MSPNSAAITPIPLLPVRVAAAVRMQQGRDTRAPAGTLISAAGIDLLQRVQAALINLAAALPPPVLAACLAPTSPPRSPEAATRSREIGRMWSISIWQMHQYDPHRWK